MKALHWYDEAARRASGAPAAGGARPEVGRHILLNRLLAAWMNDPSGPRFLELVLGASDEELRAFYQSVNGGPQRGAAAKTDPSRLPVGKLVHWL